MSIMVTPRRRTEQVAERQQRSLDNDDGRHQADALIVHDEGLLDEPGK